MMSVPLATRNSNGAQQLTSAGQSLEFGRSRLADFALQTGTVHVNHGSFGAVPNAVAEAQAEWRRTLEANPSRFFRTRYERLVRDAAESVAGLLGGDGQDWVFVDNATTAASVVLASLPLRAGDEILTTDQTYGAVRNALQHFSARHDAVVVESAVRIPVQSAEDVVEALRRCVSKRTRAVVIDHVSSLSAVVFPVARIAKLCHAAGVPVLVDGAHAPGMLDLDVPALGVDWYFGNGHKWLGAPRGCGLLWCRRDRQAQLRPLVVSHGFDEGYTAAFDWTGTRDPSAWLSVTAAIEYHRQCGGVAARRRNHRLAVAGGERLAAEFNTGLAASPALFGSMVTVRLPSERPAALAQAERLQIELETQFDVEASLVPLNGRYWLRASAAVYNEIDDLLTAGRAAAQLLA